MTASNLKIVVLSCNWNGWSCIETAAGSGISYSSSVRMVRITCLSRIHAGLMLKAFEFGADGLILLGCEADDCHFSSDNKQIAQEVEKAQDILAILGIRKERLALVQLPAFAGQEFIARLNRFTSEIENIQRARRVKTASTGISPGT